MSWRKLGIILAFFSFLPLMESSCHDGELRLVEGETQWEGRLEVCLSQRWGTVSNDGWTTANTQVVCRDLGYEHSADEKMFDKINETAVSLPIHLSHVVCSGSELGLLECNYKNDAGENSHSKDTFVKCMKANCSDGDIRLSGEDTQFMYKGRVEVCINKTWGTVNSHGWTEEDTQVVCKQLECTNEDKNSSFYLKTNRGIANSLPIHLDNVGCYGNEEMLVNCSHNTDTVEDTHSEDVWILCSCLQDEFQSTEETSNNKESDSSSATIIAGISLTIAIVCAIALVAAFIVIVVLLLQIKKMLISTDAKESSLPSNAVEQQVTELQSVVVQKRSSQQHRVTSETKHYRRKTRSCSVESQKHGSSFNRSMSTGTPYNNDSTYSSLKQNTAADATADFSLEDEQNNYFKLAPVLTDDIPKKCAKHDGGSYSKLDHNFARKETSKGSSEQETYPNSKHSGPTRCGVPIDIPQQEHSTYYNVKLENNPTSHSTPKPVPSPRTYSNDRCNPLTNSTSGATKGVAYQENMPENNYFQIELNPTKS